MEDSKLLEAIQQIIKQEISNNNLQIANLITESLEDSETRMAEKIREAESRINTKIEHSVSNKLGILFDAYEIEREKHNELKEQVENLERRVERLEVERNAG